MTRFLTLCSSSSGNSCYIGAPTYGILIDAGTNAKTLKRALSDAEIPPEHVKAIFVTHEHSDHVSALRVLASSLKIPVYATGGTMAALSDQGILNGKFPTELITERGITVGDMHITAFATSHDARESCGYRVELPDRTVGVATDTGVVTGEMLRGLEGCDLALLESNFDSDMLEMGPYPPALKARIRSSVGHLSNETCAGVVSELVQMNVRRFVLGHLSRENNSPERAAAASRFALKTVGAKEGEDYLLSVAPVGPMAEAIYF